MGEISEVDFTSQLRQTVTRINDLKNEKKQLSKLITSKHNTETEAMARSFLAQLDTLSFKYRQLLVRRLIERICVENKHSITAYARISPDFKSCNHQRDYDYACQTL